MATPDDHTLARSVAADLASVLLGIRARGQTGHPYQVRAAGDRLAHERAVELLHAARPDDAILSEEGLDSRDRLTAERVWVVDPLDGTREFGEPGRIDWAVHIALVEDGTPTAGAVALPAQDLVYATDEPPVVPPRGERPWRVVTSRSRLPHLSYAVAEALDAEIVPMGSAGAKAMAVVQGMVDVYAHAGGMYECDSAAPVAVARAAGLHVSRIDGSPHQYNRPDPWLPDLLICRPELAETCLEVVHAAWW